MTTTRTLSACILLASLPFAVPQARAQEAQLRRGIRLVRPAPPPSRAESPEERALRLLEARVDVVHRGNLLEGLDAFGRAIGLKIEVAAAAAEDLDIDETTWVDWELRGCTARAALAHFLEQWTAGVSGAEWSPVGGRIMIYCEGSENTPLHRRDLDVAGLVRAAGSGEYARKALGELPDVLTNIVEPTEWEKFGGNCRIERRGGGPFVLTATPGVRRDTVALLKAVEKAAEAKSPASVISFMDENAAVLDALKKPVTLDAPGVPLVDVLREIERQIGIAVNYDLRAFAEAGIDPNRPVTLRCRDLRASDALGRIFGGTAWMCLGGSLLVTGCEGHQTRLSIGVFDVHDLAWSEAGCTDVDPLISAIQTTIHPVAWDTVGGPGSIKPLHLEGHTFLVVSQTQEVLEEIKTLLAWIREARRKRHPVLRLEAPQRAAILRALDREAQWHFDKTPLDEAIATIAADAKIDIYFDTAALNEAGITRTAPVSLAEGRYTARAALRRILSACNLTYFIKYGGLIVTTNETLEQRMDIAVYDLNDFVAPERAWGDSECLIECIAKTVDPTLWDIVGGPGSMKSLSVRGQTFLVARHTAGHLDTVAALFDALRKVDAGRADTVILESKENARVRKALARRLAWSFDKTPLSKAAAKIAADLGVDVYVDRSGLERAGIDPDAVAVSIRCRTFDAPDALMRLLKPQKLGFVIEDASLVITTEELARYPRTIAVHRVPGPPADPWDVSVEITKKIAPETWDRAEGLGPIVFRDNDAALVISNADPVLFEVERFLKKGRGK